jgi:hypothetical protein
VPLARTLLEDLAVDALSIIANPQPEELAVVGDSDLETAGVGVVEYVAQAEFWPVPWSAGVALAIAVKDKSAMPICYPERLMPIHAALNTESDVQCSLS